MTKLIGISGSLRRGSHNAALLRTAARLMPEGAELERKRTAIRTALFVLALSLMVQIVQYLWFY